MTKGLTTTTRVYFKQGRGTRKVMKEGEAPEPPQSAVPRISRVMALAIWMHELADAGEVADYADLARLAHIFLPDQPDHEPDAAGAGYSGGDPVSAVHAWWAGSDPRAAHPAHLRGG
jgi:hypothetical protein